MTLNISIISENGGIATMTTLWKVMAFLAAKFEELTEALGDENPYDPSWMKYPEYLETRLP